MCRWKEVMFGSGVSSSSLSESPEGEACWDSDLMIEDLDFSVLMGGFD